MSWYYIRCSIVIVVIFMLNVLLDAQVSGTLTDESGEPIPFANVWAENTTKGTSTNADGYYYLSLPQGTHSLQFRVVGYQTEHRTIELGQQPITLNMRMKQQHLQLSNVTIVAGGEDPAYAIIRKAILQRVHHRDQVPSYKVEAYTKGLMQLDTTPEKVLGEEVGTLEGVLDTNGKGIVYLSETVSTLAFKIPNHYKEVVHSSKVSGDDNGLSFNQAAFTSANFYNNQIDLPRKVLSPIADAAMQYYRYHLEGSFLDYDQHMIYKIAVIPKNEEAPVFNGHLYITDELWNIHSLDLQITGKALNQPVIDTLRFQQTHMPIKAPDVWMPVSQSVSFQFSVFGFKGSGFMVTAFSDYNISPAFNDDFFKKAILIVEDSAHIKKDTYWKKVRKIPLTQAEFSDYERKDSLAAIWNSPAYIDSIDREANKLRWTFPIAGHSIQNSHRHSRWTISSPLSNIDFNAVQGWNPNVTITYRKNRDENVTDFTEARLHMSYGLSEKQFRPLFTIGRRFNSIHYPFFRITLGREIKQFNEKDPVSPVVNQLYSLIDKKNYAKLFDKRYGQVYFRSELLNGLIGRISIEYADRRGLINHTEYSFSKRKREQQLYFPNEPGRAVRPTEHTNIPFFDRSRSLRIDLGLQLTIDQKYWLYPKRKVRLGSSFPIIAVHYRQGVAAFNSDVHYHRLLANVYKRFEWGLGGKSRFFAEAGAFLDEQPELAFIDRYHFLGNQTWVSDINDRIRRFLALPYYDYSSEDYFWQAHMQHDFNGFLLDQVPLLKKLDWTLVAGGAYAQSEQGRYAECNIGLNNIGVGAVRVFRIDLVAAFPDGKYDRLYPVIGIRL